MSKFTTKTIMVAVLTSACVGHVFSATSLPVQDTLKQDIAKIFKTMPAEVAEIRQEASADLKIVETDAAEAAPYVVDAGEVISVIGTLTGDVPLVTVGAVIAGVGDVMESNSPEDAAKGTGAVIDKIDPKASGVVAEIIADVSKILHITKVLI